MKKNLLFTLLGMLLFPMLLCAQTKDKGFFIEMNGGYGTVKHNSGHDGYVFLSPAMGYQINERWAAGLRMRFE